MPEVIYRTINDLHPRFGLGLPNKGQVSVREDLPEWVKRFVTTHELYHLKDKAQWWLLREVKANLHAAIRHPVGFVACVLMSLAPYNTHLAVEQVRCG